MKGKTDDSEDEAEDDSEDDSEDEAEDEDDSEDEAGDEGCAEEEAEEETQSQPDIPEVSDDEPVPVETPSAKKQKQTPKTPKSDAASTSSKLLIALEKKYASYNETQFQDAFSAIKAVIKLPADVYGVQMLTRSYIKCKLATWKVFIC